MNCHTFLVFDEDIQGFVYVHFKGSVLEVLGLIRGNGAVGLSQRRMSYVSHTEALAMWFCCPVPLNLREDI